MEREREGGGKTNLPGKPGLLKVRPTTFFRVWRSGWKEMALEERPPTTKHHATHSRVYVRKLSIIHEHCVNHCDTFTPPANSPNLQYKILLARSRDG